MSFIATMTLRKAGRLNEALQQANADWQHEKSPHACMAMFWVQKDICDWLIKEQQSYRTIERTRAALLSANTAHRTNE